MTQAGVYGQRLGRGLHVKDAPVLITRSLRSAALAVTEVRNDAPVPKFSGSLPAEDAYLVSLKIRDYPDCECWENGRFVTKANVRAGATYLYDLKRDPRYVIDKPFHSLFFYLPRSAFNDTARQPGAPRIEELSYRPGVGHDEDVVRHIGATLLAGFRRPGETNQLFVDHMLLALTAHVGLTYGGLKPVAEPGRGGLAPWQVKRACERLDSDLSGSVMLQQIAAELGLSVSHFSRAFRISTGLPPHQWLLRQRVEAAKQLMAVRDLPLSEIAIATGFANQSHFTRVFSQMVGVSPGAWRRETTGGPDAEA